MNATSIHFNYFVGGRRGVFYCNAFDRETTYFLKIYVNKCVVNVC